MDGTERTIEIFKPFGQAFELMKQILFQPFDLRKWLVIGFAAFLCGHFGGLAFNIPSRFGQPYPAQQMRLPEEWKPWLPWAIGGFVLLVFVMVVLITWIKSRGSFIFTDCIVRNRGAVAEPWREYRKEGNSYFVFQLLVVFAAMIAVVIAAMVLVLSGVFAGGHLGSSAVLMVLMLVLLFILWVAFGIFINLIFLFMAPVMYRQRCRAVDAAREVVRLIADNPAPFVLFCLFGIVLFLGAGMVGLIAACATCCIAAIPYIGTVILLPVFVVLRSFSLLFLRQFGPEYDVWASFMPPEFVPLLLPTPSPALGETGKGN